MKTTSIKSNYNGSLTREQFLFYEMRTTAKLMVEGLSDDEIILKIVQENLYQYPTEREIKKMARVSIARLRALDEISLVEAIASRTSEEAKQICLFAMMKYYRLVWDFMITVVGEKYSKLDFSFSRMDIEVFFMRLREQDDKVASWSDSTINKIILVFINILVENDYLETRNSNQLNPVLISPLLENVIREQGLEKALPAFNCMN